MMRLSEQFQACLRSFYKKVLSVKKAAKRKTNNFHPLRRFCAHKKCCLCCLVFWCFFLGSRPFCKKKKKNKLEIVPIASLYYTTKCYPGTSEISAPSEIAVGTYFTALTWHPELLPADGGASWLLISSSVSLLLGGTVHSRNTYTVSSRSQIRSEKATKG